MKLFISHNWIESENYLKVLDLLSPYLTYGWENLSISADSPIDHNSQGEVGYRQELERQERRRIMIQEEISKISGPIRQQLQSIKCEIDRFKNDFINTNLKSERTCLKSVLSLTSKIKARIEAKETSLDLIKNEIEWLEELKKRETTSSYALSPEEIQILQKEMQWLIELKGKKATPKFISWQEENIRKLKARYDYDKLIYDFYQWPLFFREINLVKEKLEKIIRNKTEKLQSVVDSHIPDSVLIEKSRIEQKLAEITGSWQRELTIVKNRIDDLERWVPDNYGRHWHPDVIQIGSDYDQELIRKNQNLALAIMEKIRSSNILIVVASSYFAWSKWIRYEISIARESGIPVIAIEVPDSPEGTHFDTHKIFDAVVSWEKDAIIEAISKLAHAQK